MYILKRADDTYYTGSTKYLEARIEQHNKGEGANYTAKRLPLKLMYFEEYDHVAKAYYREKQIQGWSRKKKEALILGDITNIEFLAECKNENHWKNYVNEEE